LDAVRGSSRGRAGRTQRTAGGGRRKANRKRAPVARYPCIGPGVDGLDRLQVFGRRLAALRIALLLVGDLLALREATQAGALDSRDVDEDVRPAGIRLDETITLGAIEPLYGAGGHLILRYHKRNAEPN